ncbi:glycosyltransferase [Candidatus Babeliales bacterium]|nr:glycosyltransferase [Candidatus Babeliales bacterium]
MLAQLKRILIYGESWRGSIPHSILLALTRLGYEAIIFDYQKYLSELDGNRLLRKAASITDKFLFKKKCLNINQHFMQIAEDFSPQLIIIVKGLHILPETLQRINQIGIPVVNWHVDDPFNPRYITPYSDESFTLYDIHFSSRPYLFEEYQGKGARRVEYLEFCFDQTIFYPLNSIQIGKYDISFVGNWSKNREQWIKCLSPFFKVYVWGGSWWRARTLRKETNIHLMHRSATLEDYSRVVCESKICLNFLTLENRDQSNLRNFEIPACKGFQLCNRTEQLKNIFKEDKEICLYETEQELINKIRYYLKHKDERIEIAKKGFEAVTQKGHTFLSRCKQLVSTVEAL